MLHKILPFPTHIFAEMSFFIMSFTPQVSLSPFSQSPPMSIGALCGILTPWDSMFMDAGTQAWTAWTSASPISSATHLSRILD
jgi:hypothetical protein